MRAVAARRGLVLFALTAVAVGLLAWLLRVVDLSEAARALATWRVQTLPLLVLALVVNHTLRIVRFGLLLGPRVPWRAITLASLVGFLAITLVPLRLGEVARPALLARDGVPLEVSVAALVVERIFDLLALLALLLWFGATAPIAADLRVGGVDLVIVGQRTAAVAAGLGLAGIGLLAGLPDAVIRVPLLGPLAMRLASGVRRIGNHPVRAASAGLLTVVLWGVSIAYVRAGLLGFAGLPSGWMAATVTWTAIITAVTVAPTPGYFGAYEASATAALIGLGASASVGAAFALFLHLAYTLFTVAAGVPAMWALGASVRDLVGRSPNSRTDWADAS